MTRLRANRLAVQAALAAILCVVPWSPAHLQQLEVQEFNPGTFQTPAMPSVPTPPIAGSFGSPHVAPVIAGAPANPMALFGRDDRKLIEDIERRIDKLIGEISEARAEVAPILRGAEVRQMAADAFARRGVAPSAPGFRTDTKTILGETFGLGGDVHYGARLIRTDLGDYSPFLGPQMTATEVVERWGPIRQTVPARDYGPESSSTMWFSRMERRESGPPQLRMVQRKAPIDDEVIEGVERAFYSRYIEILEHYRKDLAARPWPILNALAIRRLADADALAPRRGTVTMPRRVRDVLEAEIAYLEGGHKIWKSSDKEFREEILPAYRDALLDALAVQALHVQQAAAIQHRWEEYLESAVLEYAAIPTSEAGVQRRMAKRQEIDEMADRLEGEDWRQANECGTDAATWISGLDTVPSAARDGHFPEGGYPVGFVYQAPIAGSLDMSGRPLTWPYNGGADDASLPQRMRTRINEKPACIGEPEEEVPAQITLVVPRIERPADPELLDEDDLAVPQPQPVFVRVDGIYFGHPFHVEVLFDIERPGSTYSVRLNRRHSVLVEQTEENPRLYRSATLVLTYDGVTYGGGR